MEFEPDSEKIGIARIRLSLPVCGMTAVVSGFFEADRALSAWKQASKPVGKCEYAIVFTDGAALRGRFSLKKTRYLPSLWRIVQVPQGMRTTPAGLHVDHALVDRHGRVLSTAALEHYALERS